MTGPSVKVREAVNIRAGYACEACGRSYGFRAHHHRRPRGMGGSSRPDTNQPQNLLLLCDPCHRHVESHRTEALDAGWLVPQTADPADVPVLIGPFRVRVFLTPDGRYGCPRPDDDACTDDSPCPTCPSEVA